jgi:hypothetical protein
MIARLHGLIFTTFRDFVTTQYGPAIAASVFAEQPTHVLTEAYLDEEFTAAVRKASELTGVETDELVCEFGVFAGEATFPRLYPAYYAMAGSARPFLLTVENLIHELVRATIPKATPPHLGVEPLGDDGVTIDYSSPRKLCSLLRGLVEGTARHFGQSVESDETACMHRGDERCRFECRFSESTSPAA